MATTLANYSPKHLLLSPSNSRLLCTLPDNLKMTHLPFHGRNVRTMAAATRLPISNSQLRENWLDSLSCPLFKRDGDLGIDEVVASGSDAGPEWVVGIDPDVSGALALLKVDGDSGVSAQVFDTPHVKVLVGKRVRKRLDAKSIVELLRSFNAPLGTAAYIEQSNPFPKDGKQGWWSGGFGYGLWIGVLVASGFSVIPVPSLLWKNRFDLSGSCASKDDSRKAASVLFPYLSPLLKRKKDHAMDLVGTSFLSYPSHSSDGSHLGMNHSLIISPENEPCCQIGGLQMDSSRPWFTLNGCLAGYDCLMWDFFGCIILHGADDINAVDLKLVCPTSLFG